MDYDPIKTEILRICGDPNGRRYDESLIVTAIQDALTDMNAFCPHRNFIVTTILSVSGKSVIIPYLPTYGSQRIRAIAPESPSNAKDAASHSVQTALALRNQYALILSDARHKFHGGDRIVLTVLDHYTVAGFKNGIETNIPESLEFPFCNGAAGYAMQTRAASITEVFGKRVEDHQNLMSHGRRLIEEFRKRLGEADRAFQPPECPFSTEGFRLL